jgi:ribonuclease HI
MAGWIEQLREPFGPGARDDVEAPARAPLATRRSEWTLTDLASLPGLEESLWRPETRYDAAHVARVFHPDFLELGQSGRTWTLETMAMAGEPIGVELPLPEYRVSLVAPDVALATYVSRKLDGSGAANRSSVWLRGADGWRLRFHQGTPRPVDD